MFIYKEVDDLKPEEEKPAYCCYYFQGFCKHPALVDTCISMIIISLIISTIIAMALMAIILMN
jgi:hypothetical protein